MPKCLKYLILKTKMLGFFLEHTNFTPKIHHLTYSLYVCVNRAACALFHTMALLPSCSMFL